MKHKNEKRHVENQKDNHYSKNKKDNTGETTLPLSIEEQLDVFADLLIDHYLKLDHDKK